MATDVSVATDLDSLLRESINTALNDACSSGHMPVQLELPASGVQSILPSKGVATRIPTPGAFSVVPLSPPESVRGVALDVEPAKAPTRARKRGPLVSMLLGAVALAGVMGGGATWYVHHHEAKMVAAAAPRVAVNDVPPPVAKDAPPTQVAMPIVERVEAPVVEAKPEETPATPAAPVVDTKVEARPTKHVHRTAKVEAAPKVEAPKPAPKVVEKVAEAPKPVLAAAPKPVAASKPAAGGAVDAVLQQQLNGAIP